MGPNATAAYGLGVVTPAGTVQAPAVQVTASPGAAFFPTHGGDFYRSAEFGLLLAIVAVLYIDGRVLPRKR